MHNSDRGGAGTDQDAVVARDATRVVSSQLTQGQEAKGIHTVVDGHHHHLTIRCGDDDNRTCRHTDTQTHRHARTRYDTLSYKDGSAASSHPAQ